VIPPTCDKRNQEKQKRRSKTLRNGKLFPDIDRNLPALRNESLPAPRRTVRENRGERSTVQRKGYNRRFWTPMRSLGSGTIPAPAQYFTICNRCERRGDKKPKIIWANNPFVMFSRLTDHMIEEHELECVFCYLKFESFSTLSQHVLEAHKSKEERATFVHFNPNNPMEDDVMLPAPGNGRARSTTPSGGGGRAKPSVPFLKVEDLREEPSRAKILAVKTQDAGFNDCVVKVAIGGKSFFFGLKASNENYQALFDAFGDDDNKWIGEEFLIGLKYNDFYEKNFVHVFKAPAPASEGRKKKSE
jgi:hypothetical protein